MAAKSRITLYHSPASRAFTAYWMLEELAWQRWEGERIAEERFFYDPRQTRPRKPASPG